MTIRLIVQANGERLYCCNLDNLGFRFHTLQCTVGLRDTPFRIPLLTVARDIGFNKMKVGRKRSRSVLLRQQRRDNVTILDDPKLLRRRTDMEDLKIVDAAVLHGQASELVHAPIHDGRAKCFERAWCRDELLFQRVEPADRSAVRVFDFLRHQFDSSRGIRLRFG